MRAHVTVTLAASLLAGALAASAPASAAAKPTAESRHCAQEADRQNLKGAARTRFTKTCLKEPLTAKTPTAPVAANKESQAVTKPSGVDRTTRAAQCDAEADKRGLSAQARRQFHLSCLATAGPVSEGETGTVQPKPGKSINGIGVNNYKPSATTAKSQPDANPPAAAKPQK